jgi:hypothetical protein
MILLSARCSYTCSFFILLYYSTILLCTIYSSYIFLPGQIMSQHLSKNLIYTTYVSVLSTLFIYSILGSQNSNSYSIIRIDILEWAIPEYTFSHNQSCPAVIPVQFEKVYSRRSKSYSGSNYYILGIAN